MASGQRDDGREAGVRLRAAWCLGVAMSVGLFMACALLPGESTPLQIFDLHARQDPAAYAGQTVAWQLAVSEFSAREPVAGVRIAVRTGDGSYSVLSGARWSLSAPLLLRAVLVEAFERSARVPGVGPAGTVRGQCQLSGELREFDWAPVSGLVTVTAAIRLQCGVGGEIRAMRLFSASHAIEGRGASAVASAFDAALGTLTPQVVQWTLANGPDGPK